MDTSSRKTHRAKAKESILVFCSNCEAKMQARYIACYEYPSDISEDPYRICLTHCEVCRIAILVGQDFDIWGEAPEDSGWVNCAVLWPEVDGSISDDLPESVRRSLTEAQKCLKATAYDACAVMCGRVLEAICSENGISNRNLEKNLKALLEKGMIDRKMFDWGNSLRKHRNIGAHAGEEKVSREDAKDLFEFARAITNYVLVLEKQYQSFLVRQQRISTTTNQGKSKWTAT